jgi:hypothetical protein
VITVVGSSAVVAVSIGAAAAVVVTASGLALVVGRRVEGTWEPGASWSEMLPRLAEGHKFPPPEGQGDGNHPADRIHRLRSLDRGQRTWLALLLLLVAVTGVRVVVGLLRQDAVVVGDEALISIFARDAPSDVPLIGKVTSAVLYGVVPTPHNPGPMESWTLAPFVTALGPSVGAWVYAYVVNLGSALLAAWAGFRRGGPRLGVLLLGACLAMFATAAPGGVASVLNTRIILLPLFASMVVAGAVALGDTALLAIAVALTSFVVQTHIGYAPVALAGLGAAIGVVVWQYRRGRRPKALRVHVLGAVAVGATCWALPVYDQLFRTGNLRALLRADVPRGGPGAAFDALGTLLNPERILLRHGELSSVDYAWPSVMALVVLVALGGLLLATQRRRLAAHTGLVVVAAACLLAALLTAGLTPPSDTGPEHFYWIRAVAFFLVLVLLTVVVAKRPDREATTGRRSASLIGAAVLVVAIAPLWVPKQHSPTEVNAMAAVDDLLPAVEAAATRHPVALTAVDTWPALSATDGLVAELRDRGADVLQVDDTRVQLGHTTLVVTHGSITSSDALASSIPDSNDDPETRLVPETVASWARDHRPLVLVDPGPLHVESVLDGTADTICVDRYLEDPDLLLDLDATIVADLYFEGQVASPALPFDLLRALGRWADSLPTELHAARPTPVGEESFDGLFLSTPSC